MKIRTLALTALAGLSLAACSGGGSDEAQPANETIVANIEEPANVVEVPNATVEPAPTTNVVSAETPPAATLTADEQTQDDADAAGMTARVDRSGNDSAGQPAQ